MILRSMLGLKHRNIYNNSRSMNIKCIYYNIKYHHVRVNDKQFVIKCGINMRICKKRPAYRFVQNPMCLWKEMPFGHILYL
ncbi:hypothetical protein FWK35_00022674 [Aphis craccivora]|uniref:Uncharacterized protein n=1 Tax=Aphis craccivora TaxID=307492 RepID=A0A6G0Z266_APHCR|nr:hypothetical protein FWK35_00022674 [Aphis craccivora]